MGVVIATGFTGTTYPLNNGRVCWDWYSDGNPSATTEADGFSARNAIPPRTDSSWRPVAIPATWTLDYPSARDVSFVGIARHDLGTQNATIAIEYYDGTTWTAFPGASALEPADDTPILLLTAETSVEGVRLRIAAADDEPTIAVIMVGLADEWPRPFEWVTQPLTEGDEYRYENTISVTGNWLGRSVVAEGIKFSATMRYVSEDWRQGSFQSFKEYANGEDAAFFIAMRPLDYPDEIAYSIITEPARATRISPNKSISTSVELMCQGLRLNQ